MDTADFPSLSSPAPATAAAACRSGLARSRQRGVTAIGLVFWLILVGFVVVIGLKALPTVNEYLTIKKAVERIAASAPGTKAEIVAAFDKQKDVEYSIQTIGGKDLDVHKDDAGRLVIGFAYDKEVVLYGPVSLLIHYKGESN